MTIVKAKCYSFIGSGIKPGIQAVWEDGNGNTVRILDAQTDVATVSHTVNHSDNNSGRHAALLAIEPYRLNCGKPLSTKLDFWPGGEWHGTRPFWISRNARGKKRRDMPKDRLEIFLLFPGQKLAVIDFRKAVQVVTALSDSDDTVRLASRPAEPKDVLEYLTDSGSRQNSHRAVDWALRQFDFVAKHNNIARHPAICNMRDRLNRRLEKV